MAQATAIPYADLILEAVPYRPGGLDPGTGLDCRGLALEAMRRAGLRIPNEAIAAFRYSHDHEAAYRDYMLRAGSWWRRVGLRYTDATALGDLLVASPADHPGRLHLYVLADMVGPMFLTTSPETGVVAIRGVFFRRSELEVLRFVPHDDDDR